MPDQLEETRTKWDHFGGRYTETANKRVTLQSAQHLRSHMQSDVAHNVLKVAAGAGRKKIRAELARKVSRSSAAEQMGKT
uniref:Uncharacterized protein n=1 Tax=Peronospora matthiolae TaxID=2874970 RepID=A0AAV1UPL5_9STRA